ncbi:MAG: translocated intimin receptor Tir [Terracidiphilus sp.]
MRISRHAKAVVTDTHFLIPLIVFCLGLALLIALR